MAQKIFLMVMIINSMVGVTLGIWLLQEKALYPILIGAVCIVGNGIYLVKWVNLLKQLY